MADPSSPTGVAAPPVVEIVVTDEQTDVAIDTTRWAELAAAVLRSEGRGGELTLTFVDLAEIAALNDEHMGVPGPTDVLSFPLDATDAPGTDPSPDAGPVLLGDVVICPAVAADSAPAHAGTLDDELALLTVHGVLHVLGHDHAHADETRLMRSRELELLVEFHWKGPAPAGFTQEQPPS